MSGDDFLSRWSRRKLASKAAPAAAAPPDAGVVPTPDNGARRQSPAGTQSPACVEDPQPPAPLPPVDSLTPESDFTPFMRSEVDPGLRRQALRTLFRDPRFNVMDGLDVYIDDYSKPDPIPPEWLGKLNQMARLGDCHPPDPSVDKPAEPAEAPAAEKKPAGEQQVASAESTAPSDTVVSGSPPPKLQES